MAAGRKTGGRQKGTPNKLPGTPRSVRAPRAPRTRGSAPVVPAVVGANQVRDVCRAMVDNPTYRAKLASRMNSGKIAPAVEQMIWHYAHGKPVETVKLTGGDGGPVQHHVRITIVKKAGA